MKNINWQGVFPAATTHFKDDYSLDLLATTQHVEVMIEAGIHGVIMLGTVGENSSLEYSEKLDVLKATVEGVDNRIPVLTGVAEYTTSLACRYAVDALKSGVDGLMVLPAMVYKSDRRETMFHYRSIAKATDLPIMCYNNPVAYHVDITPDMFAEMRDQETLVAIKAAAENVRRISDLSNTVGDRYLLFSGVDDLALESIMLGAVGWVAGLVNAFPVENILLWNLAINGKYQEALEIYRWFTPLLHLDTHTKLVQYIKLAMAECGLGSEATRPPRLELKENERETILEIIRQGIKNRPEIS